MTARHFMQVNLGEAVYGGDVWLDVRAAPHLLIGGASGSGKSTVVKEVVMQLVMRAAPADLELVMIDLKRVELPRFELLPHMRNRPVAVEVGEAVRYLEALCQQMSQREELMSRRRVRDLEQLRALPDVGPQPYVVIPIDECADLFMDAKYGKRGLAAAVTLARRGRASGYHAIFATQYPGVKTVPSDIRINCSARVGLRVVNHSESSVILGCPGAELLRGDGDALLRPAKDTGLVRLQCAWVPDEDIDRVVRWWVEQRASSASSAAMTTLAKLGAKMAWAAQGSRPGSDADLAHQALDVFAARDAASVRSLVRSLKISDVRAGRLCGVLASAGLIGPPEGSKSRDVRYGPGGGVSVERAHELLDEFLTTGEVKDSDDVQSGAEEGA